MLGWFTMGGGVSLKGMSVGRMSGMAARAIFSSRGRRYIGGGEGSRCTLLVGAGVWDPA